MGAGLDPGFPQLPVADDKKIESSSEGTKRQPVLLIMRAITSSTGYTAFHQNYQIPERVQFYSSL